MTAYTITETKREQSGQIVYFVRSPKGTEYAVHKGYSQWPWEVATLAKTAHGRAWRWAKDITKGAIADVLAFVQVHDATANNVFDQYGRLMQEKPAEAPAPKAETISVSLTVSDQFLRDVLCTAIEGGSNYWAIFRSKDVIEGEYTHEYTAATVCGTGETRDDFKPKRIGLPELREGVRVMLERGKCAVSYRETLLRAVIEDDAGDCDADLSDLILQSAMFDGDVVYG